MASVVMIAVKDPEASGDGVGVVDGDDCVEAANPSNSLAVDSPGPAPLNPCASEPSGTVAVCRNTPGMYSGSTRISTMAVNVTAIITDATKTMSITNFAESNCDVTALPPVF